MYDVRRLRLLRELAERGTLAEVASALRHSPSSVSQQLSLLEREVGVPLLVPLGRGVALTPDGQLLAERAGEVLRLLERAESDIAARSSAVAGPVRLAVFQSAALALLPATLSALARDHPGLRVEAVQHEPESALRRTAARDFDLVVAEQYPHHATARYAGLDRRPLVADRLRLALPVEAEGGGITDAADLPWVMEPRGSASRHWAEQRCRVAGFEPDVRYESADLEVHIRLVESGNAAAILPDLVWVGRVRSVRLVELEGAPRRQVFTAAREAGAGRPALQAVRSALETVAAGAGGS